jgi:predicted site-specific integrase-resolvase
MKKLSDYAKENKITYRTAWNRYKKGKIENTIISETGHILIKEENKCDYSKVAIYCRVSSNENRINLEAQSKRLKSYAMAKGYQIVYIVKEVGSGVNDKRKKLLKLFDKEDWGTLIVEHKDRLTRFGYNYIEKLLEKTGRRIEVVNIAESNKEDLIQDLVAIIYSFSSRLYGLRRHRKKTEKIIECIKKELNDDKPISS